MREMRIRTSSSQAHRSAFYDTMTNGRERSIVTKASKSIHRAALRLPAMSMLLLLALAPATPAQAQQTADQMMAAQRSAIGKLAGFAGEWRGTGWSIENGKRVPETVTVRAGPFLDDATLVIEMRSYRADGSLRFHAFNNVVFDAQGSKYEIQARAGGRYGNFPFRATGDGYVWELIFNGSGLRYTATLANGVWTEVTDSVARDRPSQKIAEFTLRRIGDSAWPEAGAISMH